MRKRLLTAEEKKEVLALISAGFSQTTVARYVRCSPSTLRRELLENPEFAEQVAKAGENSEVFYLSCIRKAAQQHWRAAAWALERRVPKRYGNRKADSLTAEQVQKFMTECLKVIADELPKGELREKILERLSEKLDGWEE